jgi:hypothetical protein
MFTGYFTGAAGKSVTRNTASTTANTAQDCAMPSITAASATALANSRESPVDVKPVDTKLDGSRNEYRLVDAGRACRGFAAAALAFACVSFRVAPAL